MTDVILIIFEFDDFGVGKEAEPVWPQWAREEGLGLLMHFFEQLFDLFWGIAQAQRLQRRARGGKAFGPQENVLEQLLVSAGQMALMFGQDRRIEALPGAWPLHRNWGRAYVERAGRGIAVSAVLGVFVQVKLPFLAQGRLEHLGETHLEQPGQILRRKGQPQFSRLPLEGDE